MSETEVQVLDVLDCPVSEVPEGYLPREWRHTYSEKPFCFLLLAQKVSTRLSSAH